jgi:pimeloyl-ACP methyl ester carboxylesterase
MKLMFMSIRLQNKVIDIEVANGTPSPTVDPSVHAILIGHSMGGIVGAETLLLLASEQPIPHLSASQQRGLDNDGIPFFMFPHIQGLMAFDTPFLGIAPGVLSHGAQEHYQSASSAYDKLNGVAGLFGYGSKSTTTTTTTSTTAAGTASSVTKSSSSMALPPATTDAAADAAAMPSWSRWGKMAMFAGAAGAVAAGGAAALYSQRERLTEGWRWVGSHLEFVGCLARPADLRNRVASLADIQQERGIKAVIFYTCLGQGAPPAPPPAADNNNASSLFLRIPRARNRTFCHLPEDFDANDHMLAGDGTPDHPGIKWVLALNDKAPDETTAHITIFGPRDNPKYYMLAHEAADTIVRWIDQGWYASATSSSTAAATDGPGDDTTVTEEVEKGEEGKDDFIVL